MKTTLRALGGGVAVGIANVIPGVSGGTMMTIMNIFDRTMIAISGLAKKDNKNRFKDILFLAEVGLGAVVGIVLFSKLLQWIDSIAPMPTVFWFAGLVALSVPVFKSGQMKGMSIQWVALSLGVALVAALTIAKILFFPEEPPVIDPATGLQKKEIWPLPDFTPTMCVVLLFAGIAGGFAMLLPGVSGSLVLMIIGLYETIWFAYVNNASGFASDIFTDYIPQAFAAGDPMLVFNQIGSYLSENFVKYIPAAFFAVGMLLGIFLSAKITDKALAWNKRATLSFLLGLVSASAVSIVAINTLKMTANVWMILASVLSFVFGGAIVWLLGKVTSD